MLGSISLAAILLVFAASCAAGAHAQYQDAVYNSITVEVGTGSSGLGVHVTHVLEQTNVYVRMQLIDREPFRDDVIMRTGTGQSGETTTNVTSSHGTVMLPPSKDNIAVEYGIADAISLEDGIYSLEFAYPHTTVFHMPDNAEVVFVNGRHVELDGKQKIACHGCDMTLEYAHKAPYRTFMAGIDGYATFLVKVSTQSEVTGFEFNVTNGEIIFQTDEGRQFVTVTVPTDLMTGPFTVSLDGKKIFYQNSANDTHSTIVMRLESGGAISIAGTVAQHILEQHMQDLVQQQDAGSTQVVIAAVVGLGIVAAVAVITTKKRFNRR